MSTEVTLFGAVNTVATQVKPVTPWTFVGEVPDEVLASKAEFSKWRSMPSTEWLVYTGSEGDVATIRCSKTNKLRRLHALIADFDALISDADCASLLARCPADLRPTWLTRTFSNGVRLVWMFEAPLALEVGDLAKEFLKIAWRELKVQKLFAGADEPAWMDLAKLYDVGREWKQVTSDTLKSGVLHHWLFEASKKVRWGEQGEIFIPIEAVADEVEKQFPGRWEGPFEVGRRGVVFFNPCSVNPTAAIVAETGMICFGEDQLFHPWSKIFGGSFVKKFQQDKIGTAVSHVWYDGKNYFRKSAYGVWEPHSKEDFQNHLRTRHAIDSGKSRGDTASEMDYALAYVNDNRRVTGVLPRVYDPQEVLYSNNKRFLNCAAVVALQPVDVPQEWGVNFPWLAEFLDTCFDPTPVPCVVAGKPAQPAKVIFRAWLKRFYCSALAGSLRKGQALFIAGGVGSGKTLLATKILPTLMGGAADASHFLNSNTQFNKELLEVGLWNLDDTTVSQDPQAALKFTEMVKAAVANPYFNYRAMYRDAQRVEWHGRVLVTLNDDQSSIRILPNLDTSIEDKIIVLRFSDVKRKFPDWHELDDIIARETPFFARWLIDWQSPEELDGDKRFGIDAYIHEELRIKSLHAGGVSDLLELIDVWIKRSAADERLKTGVWRGSASEWMAELSVDDLGLRPLVAKFTPRALGRKFVEASRIRGSRVTVIPNDHGNLYEIALGGETTPARVNKIAA